MEGGHTAKWDGKMEAESNVLFALLGEKMAEFK